MDHDQAIGAEGGARGVAESRLQPAGNGGLSESESDSDDGDLFVNTNRPTIETQFDDSYSSDST